MAQNNQILQYLRQRSLHSGLFVKKQIWFGQRQTLNLKNQICHHRQNPTHRLFHHLHLLFHRIWIEDRQTDNQTLFIF